MVWPVGSRHPLRQPQLLQLLRGQRPSPEPRLLWAAGGRGDPGPGATGKRRSRGGAACSREPPTALGFPRPGTFSSQNFSVLKSEDSIKII
ncbi:hypothetical protein VULLAG_LOCUS11349 [Vulpes lagopus]